MTNTLKMPAASRTLALAVMLAGMAAGPVAAQESSPPTNVTVVGAVGSATVAWTPVSGRGVTYRVLRSPSAKERGRDLPPPITMASFVDPKVEPGMTYFYQVIAGYRDGTAAAAEPVGFTVPRERVTQPIAASLPDLVPLTLSASTAVATVGGNVSF